MALSEKLLERLQDLRERELMAAERCAQAVGVISSAFVRSRLRAQQADHARHVAALDGLAHDELGHDLSEPARRSTPRAVAGTPEEAIEEAREAARELLHAYHQALADRSLPDDQRQTFDEHRADVSRHLDWMYQAVTLRLWRDDVQLEPP